MSDPQAAPPVRLRARPHWRDAVTALPALVVFAGTVTAFVQGTEIEEPEMVLLVILALGALPIVNGCFLLRGAIVAELDPRGVRLYRQAHRFLHRRRATPEFDLPWSEVQRLVLWHRTMARRDFSYSVTMLGVQSRTPLDAKGKATVESLVIEPDPDLLGVFGGGHPREGLPAHLPDATIGRSVVFSVGGARGLAAAVARFAPGVPVIDARKAERPRRVEAPADGT
ncbi:hypothetical protein [Glycomyces harbinensis]|uniref:Uncharacterized protein n=1 Tax=Glycomyces harbinensis TaxID=58114 RepID=A0A1G7BW76_9ACTN|nr:hypothetical protein [Glycomyces harbinensis]SDE31361.1 hypothetical protein SAMN05216270_11813 [Glycomyces harbinensis]